MFLSTLWASVYVIIVLMANKEQTVNGFPFDSTRIDRNMNIKYETLASDLLQKISTKANYQHWVGIAGPPGAGKSTLSAAVSQRINELAQSEVSIVLPMDGYHYTRAQLRAMGEADGAQYSYEQLLARRGAPWTFDPKSLVFDMQKAKRESGGVFPLYERKLSDPVSDALRVLPSHRIVLVEGNYLLNFDDADWAPLRDVFDEKWFVTCKSFNCILDRLVNRHLQTWTEEKTRMFGEGAIGAKKKAESNDLLNAQFIIDCTMKYADMVIESE